jgi:hypothetical protein
MHRVAILSLVLLAVGSAQAVAQQATVSTPFVTTSDSFFEQIGVSWGLNFKNGFVRFGPGPARAPLGNPPAGGGMNFGFGGPGGYFNLNAAQGSRRSIVSQTPSVTLQNGATGGFHDASISPFVISHVPVVGGAPAIPYAAFVAPPYGFGLHSVSPAAALPAPPPGNWRVQQALRQARTGETPVAPDAAEPTMVEKPHLAAGLAPRSSQPVAPTGTEPTASRPGLTDASDGAGAPRSTAARPAASLVELEQQRQQEQATAGEGDRKAEALFQRGLAAERTGKLSVARIYYQMAQRRASGELLSRIDARLSGLDQ